MKLIMKMTIKHHLNVECNIHSDLRSHFLQFGSTRGLSLQFIEQQRESRVKRFMLVEDRAGDPGCH